MEVRTERFSIINEYYYGNLENALSKIKKLYDGICIRTDLPQWLKDDILIDYRSLQFCKYNFCHEAHDENDAHEKLVALPHMLNYPDIDRLSRNFNNAILKDISESNYKNIYSTYVGNDRLVYEISKIASVGITALFYGSLTQLWQLQRMLKKILLRFSEKYSDVLFKKQLLKLCILHPEKEVEEIISKYDYIWEHCSQTELGNILPLVFAAKYLEGEKALKATVMHLGNFLNERDFLLLENKFFSFAEEKGHCFYTFQEVLPSGGGHSNGYLKEKSCGFSSYIQHDRTGYCE